MQPGKMQERQIETGVITPYIGPFGLFQERRFIKLAPTPVIKRRLHAPGQHLQAQDQVGISRMQRGQHVMLPTVMIPVVMNFAQQHDRFAGEIGKQPAGLDLFAGGWIQPLRRKRIALRLAIVGRHCAKAVHCETGANNKKSAEKIHKRKVQTISTPEVENSEAFYINTQASRLQTTLAGRYQRPLRGRPAPC